MSRGDVGATQISDLTYRSLFPRSETCWEFSLVAGPSSSLPSDLVLKIEIEIEIEKITDQRSREPPVASSHNTYQGTVAYPSGTPRHCPW